MAPEASAALPQPQVQHSGSRSTAPSLATTGNAAWPLQDQRALLNYLVDRFAEAGDNGHFKTATFRAAAVELEKIRTQGGPKTHTSCLTKYRAVRDNVFYAI